MLDKKNDIKKMHIIFVSSGEYYGETINIKPFQDAGFNTSSVTIPTVCEPWNLWVRMKIRFSLDYSRYTRKKEMTLISNIDKIDSNNPIDIVYIDRAIPLQEATIKILKKKYMVVFTPVDRLTFHMDFLEAALQSDVLYLYSKEDVDIALSKGCNAVYAPTGGGSPDFAFNMNITRDIDISFVGRMYPDKDYLVRREMLERLVLDFKEQKIVIGGECAPIRRPLKYLHWLCNPRFRETFLNKDLSRKECNLLYNRSKICINIERQGAGNTWSDRLTNIMYSGAFQIVTYNEIISSTFGCVLDTFQTYEELKSKIQYYLAHDKIRNDKAEKGYELIHMMDSKNSFSVVKDLKDQYFMWKKRRKNNE